MGQCLWLCCLFGFWLLSYQPTHRDMSKISMLRSLWCFKYATSTSWQNGYNYIMTTVRLWCNMVLLCIAMVELWLQPPQVGIWPLQECLNISHWCGTAEFKGQVAHPIFSWCGECLQTSWRTGYTSAVNFPERSDGSPGIGQRGWTAWRGPSGLRHFRCWSVELRAHPIGPKIPKFWRCISKSCNEEPCLLLLPLVRQWTDRIGCVWKYRLHPLDNHHFSEEKTAMLGYIPFCGISSFLFVL